MKKSNHIKVFEDFDSNAKKYQDIKSRLESPLTSKLKELPNLFGEGPENEVLEMELDFGYNSDTEMALFLQDCIQKHRLTITRFDVSGPGGGNPRVFLVGLRKNLRGMLEANGFEDVEYHLEGAKPFDITTLKDFRGIGM